MIGRGSRSILRMVGVVVLLTLVLGAGACGDSDDSDNGADGASAAQGQSAGGDDAAAGSAGSDGGDADDGATAGDATPESEARSAYEEYIDAFYAKDAQGACDRLSEKSQRQWGAGDSGGCEKALETFLDPIQDLADSPRPHVVKLRVDGERAVITAVTGKNDDSKATVPLVKEGGEWKVDVEGGLGGGI